MKYKKQLLSGLLAAVLLCGAGAAASGTATGENRTSGDAAQPASDAISAFSDVDAGAWYAGAAAYVREKGIMNGTDADTFGPDLIMSRAMLVTVLYQAAGSPAVSGVDSFTDTEEGAYYSDAVVWAVGNGIISGYGGGLFGTDDPVSREQIASILWRYDGSKTGAAVADFTDSAEISAYAAPAVDWAAENGIVTGNPDGSFGPEDSATRAQAAVMLYHYLDPGTQGSGTSGPAAPSGRSLITNSGARIAFSALEHRTDSADASQVFYLSDISPEAMVKIYNALDWTPAGKVAVKLSTGEPPASNYLRPELIADLVRSVNGTIVECNTAYGGSRAGTAMHYQVAEDHGFTAIADFQILDENGSMTLPVEGGTVLSENYVGAAFADYDSYLVLSHFKGHAMAGYGGAIKNISIGLGSAEGKSWIHSGGTTRTGFGGSQDAFLESMGDAGKAVSDYLGGGERIVYINVMNRLSVDCDCDGDPAEPDMHDIGILASRDPVALDQACIDLVYASNSQESAALRTRIESRNGIHTLENAQSIGLGSRSYRLTDVDPGSIDGRETDASNE